ncbi:IpaC/SipC family type III secretion system effector [Burkholderia sp. BE17]|uniref:IpaC/SipC family type III secretion system effector n=1 Tax=Burkholderia sp. BE17 TaxID=2656644 RepID=UPI00128B03D5|nr:IpaC/SipC family type III secretion system effector [Burkholderia sp. BE17]MPV70214.1 hypothetical protein [Burkholderia sp. BE17]
MLLSNPIGYPGVARRIGPGSPDASGTATRAGGAVSHDTVQALAAEVGQTPSHSTIASSRRCVLVPPTVTETPTMSQTLAELECRPGLWARSQDPAVLGAYEQVVVQGLSSADGVHYVFAEDVGFDAMLQYCKAERKNAQADTTVRNTMLAWSRSQMEAAMDQDQQMGNLALAMAITQGVLQTATTVVGAVQEMKAFKTKGMSIESELKPQAELRRSMTQLEPARVDLEAPVSSSVPAQRDRAEPALNTQSAFAQEPAGRDAGDVPNGVGDVSWDEAGWSDEESSWFAWQESAETSSAEPASAQPEAVPLGVEAGHAESAVANVMPERDGGANETREPTIQLREARDDRYAIEQHQTRHEQNLLAASRQQMHAGTIRTAGQIGRSTLDGVSQQQQASHRVEQKGYEYGERTWKAASDARADAARNAHEAAQRALDAARELIANGNALASQIAGNLRA